MTDLMKADDKIIRLRASIRRRLKSSWRTA